MCINPCSCEVIFPSTPAASLTHATYPHNDLCVTVLELKHTSALLPLLFLSYAIAYVDRINVSLAKLEMSKSLEGFNNAVIGFGAGIFFLGYFILEIPGTL